MDDFENEPVYETVGELIDFLKKFDRNTKIYGWNSYHVEYLPLEVWVLKQNEGDIIYLEASYLDDGQPFNE